MPHNPAHGCATLDRRLRDAGCVARRIVVVSGTNIARRPHRGDEPIPGMAHGLNVARTVRIIAQGFPQLFDREIQPAVKVAMRFPWPQRVFDRPARDQLVGTCRKQREHSQRLRWKIDLDSASPKLRVLDVQLVQVEPQRGTASFVNTHDALHTPHRPSQAPSTRERSRTYLNLCR
ncbi:MAG TPA: hypothetical protein VKA07_10440 [Candidatus Sulfotelmatobacter sp.]|nr:hypothetical protein [Candidatus Sulfotelmatobacter sp.]HLM82716.1 hypothetical protein [Terriglobales bacterium]